MAQQTAVDWLVERFEKFLAYYEGHRKAEPYTIQELSNDFEEAKQKEREQIIKAHNDGDVWSGEIYYTKTYGK